MQVPDVQLQTGPDPDLTVQEPVQAGGAGHAGHLHHPQRQQQALLQQRRGAQTGRGGVPGTGRGAGQWSVIRRLYKLFHDSYISGLNFGDSHLLARGHGSTSKSCKENLKRAVRNVT